MNNKIVSVILFDLAGLTPDWIDEKYNNLYTRWKFDNSDDVWLDGRLIDKAEKQMIKISLYNIKPTPNEIIVSEKKAGFPLTEKMFIDKMISKLSKFTDADYPDDTWQMRINLFMDYLKKKQQQTNMNNYEIEPIESIQQKVDAIPAISDKIIYLIEYRADFIMKYNPVDVPKPENPNRWHVQSYTFILLKQIETLIEKYEQLMKYQTVTSAHKPHPILIKQISEKQQKNLFRILTKSLFFSKETDFASFCFVFGNSIKPDDFKALQWRQNRQLLRELILYLKHPDIEIPTSKYKLPDFFIDKGNKKIIELPTNTPKDAKILDCLPDLAKI